MKFYLNRILVTLSLLLAGLPLFYPLISLDAETTLDAPASGKAVIFPDFDKGVMRNGKSKKIFLNRLKTKTNKPNLSTQQERLNMLRSNYERIVSIIQQNSSNKDNGAVRIPRIVHQIWLGSDVPDKYQEWMSTWMNLLGWKYILWTDKEVAQLNLINQQVYDKAKNYGAKSDILRIELLYMMGGLYVDTDFECLNPNFFEVLHNNVDFYIGIEPLEHSLLRINNALIGSIPAHPLLHEMINQLPANFEANKHKWPLASTGPIFLTKIIYDYMKGGNNGLDLFLPCSLVYPFNAAEVDRCAFPNMLKPMKESAAIHYWSKSWYKPQKTSQN